jgi:protein EFR3
LKPVSISAPEQLTIEKASRQDILFMRKHIPEISLHIYENIQFTSNTAENYNAIYTTLALLCVELSSEETLTELLRLTFAIQEVATLKGLGLPESCTAAIHSLVSGFLNLIAHLTAIPALCSHIEQVIKLRLEKCPWLLAECFETSIKLKRSSSNDSRFSSFEEISDELLFNKTIISEALRSSGHDTNKLLTPFVSRDAGIYV